MVELIICIPHESFSGDQIDKNAVGGARITYTGFWWENLRERDHLEDRGADGRIILRWIVRKWGVRAWTGSIWLRIGIGDGHL